MDIAVSVFILVASIVSLVIFDRELRKQRKLR